MLGHKFSSAGREDSDVRMLGRGDRFIWSVFIHKYTLSGEEVQKPSKDVCVRMGGKDVMFGYSACYCCIYQYPEMSVDTKSNNILVIKLSRYI
jgi:hypothetical protein